MKTFFLALILGIFIGSIVTNYFADPQAYQQLEEAKARLFNEEVVDEVAETVSEPTENSASGNESEPARFDVGSGNLEESAEESEESPQPLPLPTPANKEESPEAPAKTEDAPPEASPQETPADPTPQDTVAPSAPVEEEAAKLSEEEPKSRSEELIEEGVKKSEEIAKTVTEKAQEVAQDAKPLIENGIDFTIATGIRAKYKLERGLDTDAIKISVEDKIVTLSGTVDSEAAKKKAIEIAVFTKGVNGVEETLSIAE